MPSYTLQRPAPAPTAGPRGTNTGYYMPSMADPSAATGSRAAGGSAIGSIDRIGIPGNLGASPDPMQSPGNNLTNMGYGEQAFEYTQNRLLEDPFADFMRQQAMSTMSPSAGESYMNQNLGSLDGPGMGEQYWNQMSGQYQNPFAGEQFARLATQNFDAQGPASAFYDQAMGDYGSFANYQGAGNSQGQYGQSSAALANGTQGEQGLGQLAGMYGEIGQYGGANNAQAQYQQNAQSGPLAAQQFFNQVGGQYGQLGQYQGGNNALSQYEQTQQAFGDLPIANFDPFYDRARQLATQDYNRQSAGRGVYGSSEALSGVGNVITDIEAQRANRSFDAEMQRAVEQRNRQQLLGTQASAADQTGLAAFNSNLQGLSTFGNLANQAGNQTLGQQTMLGNQARNADLSSLDAFNANLSGASTFANINNMQGNLELGRHQTLGSLANNADSQATAAQNARISGVNAFGNLASSADAAETNRYQASTNAMNQADQTQLNRMNSGADVAFRGDDSRRSDYTASMNAAQGAAGLQNDRTRLGVDIANTGSNNDLQRLNSFNNTAQGAESQRQARQIAKLDSMRGMSQDIVNAITNSYTNSLSGNQADWENTFNASIAPQLQSMGMDQQRIDAVRKDLTALAQASKKK